MPDVESPVAVEPSAQAPAAPVTAPAEPVSTEPTTVAEHEARYGPNGTGEPAPADASDEAPLDDVVDESPEQRQRGSRAKSKQAAARINRLTAEKNELRQRLEALEKAQKIPASETPKATVPYVPPVPSVEFNDPEPTLDQFADKDDPYGEWMLAKTDWRANKREAERQAQHMQAHQQQISRHEQDYWNGVNVKHQERLVAAMVANPQGAQALQSIRAQVTPPPLLDRAIMLDDDSGNVVLFLASHPNVLDELVLGTAALPVTEETVAITRRLLRQRMTAETTGSVAPSQPLPNAPRPPNPVRTGLIRTTDDPPAEDVSIADHAKYHMPKRR